jgi:hypothetical protein
MVTRFMVGFGLILAIIAASFGAAPVSALPTQPGAPQDVPVPVVSDFVEEWSVGNGLIYWAYNCSGDEFVSTAALKRMPVSGGTQRTLESIDDFSRCNTFLNQINSSDGLIYFDDSQGRLERTPLSSPFTPVVIKNLVGDDKPVYGSRLAESNGYLYWIGFQRILRTLKDGSGPVETVATTAVLIGDVLPVGNTVYWTDTSGVWTISVGCAALPCTDTKNQFAPFPASSGGYGLVYLRTSVQFQRYSVFWVQYTSGGGSTSYAIKGRSCNDLTICTLDPPFTFYSASANWYIGRPVVASDTLYWTERDISTFNNPTGDIKRKLRTAPAATPPDTIATGQANIDRNLFVAADMLFFARAGTTIYKLPLAASAIVRDFEASAMEVTQGIQNLANNVPLVAKKTTYVRAYGRQLSGPSTSNVEARLFGTVNGLALPGSPLPAINGARALTTGGSFDRARLNDGWYFLLPASWIGVGTVTFRLEVDGRHIHSDPNLANNEISATLGFQSQPPVCVWTVPVRTHTPLPSTNDPNFWSMVDHFKRRWPVPDVWIYRDTNPVEELQISWWGPIPHPSYGPYELEDGWSITNGPPDRDKVIMSLWARAQLSFNPDACDDIGAPVHFMGMVHPSANNGGASGYASTVSKQSWVQLPSHTPNPVPAGWDKLRAGSVMAQELAHNFGRKHVNCGNPDNIDTSYPYPPCQIANVGPTSYYGFDVTTREPIRPDQTADFMSYASRSWVSDYTWRALMNKFSVANTAPAAPTAPTGDSVFVTGMVDLDTSRGEIGTLLVLPTASVPPATRQSLAAQTPQQAHAPHVTYKLRLLDAAGAVLTDRTLVPIPMDDHSPDGAAALFSDMFPAPAGAVAKVQLLADSTVVATLQPGPAAPSVSVSQPASGATINDSLTIGWSAGDADEDDKLLFTIQYSHDGGSEWHTLATNYPSTPLGSYTLTLADLGAIQGSAPNAARIRVLASDGYHTAIATSQPFTVANRKPATAIVAPAAGANLAAGQAVALQGSALDPEDGGLGDAALAWTVDGVAAGAGTDTEVAGLAPGAHTAGLSATDSAGQSASASSAFTIAPLSIPGPAAAPLLDGFCEDAAYATAAMVQLKPYADGSQASVRIVRGSDQLWACFSGLKHGTLGTMAGIRLDRNNSRDALAQSDDYAFLVGEDGSVSMQAGDGAGGFVDAGPQGFQGQVSSDTAAWNAELRIDKTLFGGWNHLAGVQLSHAAVDTAGDSYSWPYSTTANAPSTWATAALGMQPAITALEPPEATVNDPGLTLSVRGTGFLSGTLVLWNGAELPTTFVDSEHLTAQVGAGQLAAAGQATVSTRSPDSFESNDLTFQIHALPPAITSLAPAAIRAGGPATTLTINGTNFAPGAQVLWNGAPLTTQFISSTQLRVQLAPALIAQGQTVGIAVQNSTPDQQISNDQTFEVLPQGAFPIYLPLIRR